MLKHLINHAAKKLGKEIKAIVATVPAYWNSAKRKLTKISGSEYLLSL